MKVDAGIATISAQIDAVGIASGYLPRPCASFGKSMGIRTDGVDVIVVHVFDDSVLHIADDFGC